MKDIYDFIMNSRKKDFRKLQVAICMYISKGTSTNEQMLNVFYFVDNHSYPMDWITMSNSSKKTYYYNNMYDHISYIITNNLPHYTNTNNNICNNRIESIPNFTQHHQEILKMHISSNYNHRTQELMVVDKEKDRQLTITLKDKDMHHELILKDKEFLMIDKKIQEKELDLEKLKIEFEISKLQS